MAAKHSCLEKCPGGIGEGGGGGGGGSGSPADVALTGNWTVLSSRVGGIWVCRAARR